MKFGIRKRDFKFFILGMLAAFLFATVYNWDENVRSFKKGFAKGYSESPELFQE